MRPSSVAIWLSLLANKHAVADWQYRSRPDPSSPRLNFTIPGGEGVEQTYLFVAPFAGFSDTLPEQQGPSQADPYIFHDNGDLVRSGYRDHSIWATNFRTVKRQGKMCLPALKAIKTLSAVKTRTHNIGESAL